MHFDGFNCQLQLFFWDGQAVDAHAQIHPSLEKPLSALFCIQLYKAQISIHHFQYSVKSLSKTECEFRGSTLTSLKCWSPGCQDEVRPDFSWHRFFLEQGSPACKENISVLGQSCFLLRGLVHATQSECHLDCNKGNHLCLLCWNSCHLQLRRDIWLLDLQNRLGKFTIDSL